MLTQGEKLVGLFSYKFKGGKPNYNTVEKEFLGIYLSFLNFRTIVFNGDIKVFTNSKDLTERGKDSTVGVQK